MRIKVVVMKHGMVPEFELLSQAIDASHPGQQPIQVSLLHGDLEAIWQRNRNSGVRSLPKISGN